MLTDDPLARSLRAALPPIGAARPSRDLWPSVVDRTNRAPRWSLVDWTAATVVVAALLLFPEWFWFLTYHL
jgi:hypothetical protein